MAVPERSLPLSYQRQIGFAAAERRQILHQRWYQHHLQQQRRGWSSHRNKRDTELWFRTFHADEAGFRQVYFVSIGPGKALNIGHRRGNEQLAILAN